MGKTFGENRVKRGMEYLSPYVTCGLRLEAKNSDEKTCLISHLGNIVAKADSFVEVEQSDDNQRFSRAKYFKELRSQLSISSGYSSVDSISSYGRTQRSALLQSQALSVICQLEETVENRRIVAEMQGEPWRFHHTMQLLDWENSCVFAKQDFYELSPELPLVNVSLHSNRTIVRYNLFVKNLRRMRKFYAEILQINPCFVADDYCCFILKSTGNYEVQFSLKRSRHLEIFVARSSHLVFERSYSMICGLTQAVIDSHDPEGNSFTLVSRPEIEMKRYSKIPCSLKRCDSSQSHGSSTFVGDCSLIRTRRKPSNRSSSTSESGSTSDDSLCSQDGMICSACPIVL